MSAQSIYRWPSRRSSKIVVDVAPTQQIGLTPSIPPTRPATTTPTRPAPRTSFGAAIIHTNPPPKTRAQYLATIDQKRIGPTRMPSYVGGLLDAFSIENIDNTSFELDRSFEVSPRSMAESLPPVDDRPPTNTCDIEFPSRTSSPEPTPTVQFQGLSISFPERLFNLDSVSECAAQCPSPSPSRPRAQTPRRIRLDSADFEKPPQSFSSASLPADRPRRKSCILNCVRRGMKRAGGKAY